MKKRRRGWMWIVLPVLVGAGVYIYSSEAKDPSPTKVKGKGKGPGGAAEGAATPVIGSKAQKGDIGVYFNGLGAVTPIFTVTIKSRVDGELMSVHFREGDTVQ